MKKLKILIIAFAVMFLGIGSVYALNVPNNHLVSPRWVYNHMRNKNVVIVDIRVPRAYSSGHIPGSVDIPFPSIMQKYIGINVLGNIASPQKITNIYRRAGITNRSIIIFTGAGMSKFPLGYSSETRALWTAWFYGLRNTAILNGGLAAWMYDKLPVTTTPSRPMESNFKIATINLRSRVSYQRIWKYLETRDAVLIDARPVAWYKGMDHDKRFVKHGHVPGAINVPFKKFEKISRRGYYEFVTPREARIIMIHAGVNLRKPMITYCNTGYWASLDWFVAKFVIGKKNVADYNGSWTQYSRIPNAPIVDLHIHNYKK